MPRLEDLYARRCVKDLIHVIEQVPVRAAVRAPLVLDKSSVALVVLWTLLRWERTFLLVSLEGLGVDMWQLTCELDALIKEKKTQDAAHQRQKAYDPRSAVFHQELNMFLELLLDRAGREASALEHPWLGTEHVLLAIIAGADGPLSSLLSRHGIDYATTREAILAALRGAPATVGDEPILLPASDEVLGRTIPRHPTLEFPADKPWGAGWDTQAVGVPRRFGLAVMFLMVIMYTVLFAVMQMMDADPPIFVIVAVLVTGVGLGQILLFGGKYPRAASIWAGACLLPVEVFVAGIGLSIFGVRGSAGPDISQVIAWTIFAVPLGAFFGYLSGGLTAGVFLVLEMYVKKKAKKEEEEEEKEEEDREDEDEQEEESEPEADPF